MEKSSACKSRLSWCSWLQLQCHPSEFEGEQYTRVGLIAACQSKANTWAVEGGSQLQLIRHPLLGQS